MASFFDDSLFPEAVFRPRTVQTDLCCSLLRDPTHDKSEGSGDGRFDPGSIDPAFKSDFKVILQTDFDEGEYLGFLDGVLPLDSFVCVVVVADPEPDVAGKPSAGCGGGAGRPTPLTSSMPAGPVTVTFSMYQDTFLLEQGGRLSVAAVVDEYALDTAFDGGAFDLKVTLSSSSLFLLSVCPQLTLSSHSTSRSRR